MQLLLDTHTFLWFLAGDSQLPVSLKKRIEDLNTDCYLSTASVWEITIKQQTGKLTLNISIEEIFDFLTRNNIQLLKIDKDHFISLSKLPIHHKDPFDRLIIAQAISENLPIASKDTFFKSYKVKLLWD